MIKLENVTKTYKRHVQSTSILAILNDIFKRKYITVNALNKITFNIEPGEKVGLLGPNGSGKTTTMKLLSGILKPTTGQIEIDGYRPFLRNKEFLKRISLIMGHKSQLWWDLPALDTFLLLKEIYEIPNAAFNDRLEYLVDGFNISKLLNIQVRKLSLGERMKMEIISMLLHNPNILLLDEPTIGLDFEAQLAIRTMLNNYNKQFKTTMLLTSHYLADVTNLCNRVIVLSKGNIIYDGTLENLKYEFTSYLNLTIKDPNLNPEIFSNLGKLINHKDNKINLQIPRNNLPYILETLKQNNFYEFLIEEPPIEDAIKGLFDKSFTKLGN